MSHTIELEVPEYDKAIIICNGDFSGTAHLRMWKLGFDFHKERAPDVDVDLPHGTVVAIVRAYLHRWLPSLAETWIPRLIDRLIPSVKTGR